MINAGLGTAGPTNQQTFETYSKCTKGILLSERFTIILQMFNFQDSKSKLLVEYDSDPLILEMETCSYPWLPSLQYTIELVKYDQNKNERKTRGPEPLT